jgi:isoleucyl-tRNA synthetase
MMEEFETLILLKHKIIDNKQFEKTILDEHGKFTNIIPEFEGRLFYDISDDLIYQINENRSLFDKKSSNNSIHTCDCGQIVINRISDSWMMDIEKIEDKLKQANEEINWKPPTMKNNIQSRLEIKEWNISKTGFFGTPVPIWTNEKKTEIVCIGSISELEKLSGKKIQNIRREDVDSILIPSKDGNSFLKRVEEVFTAPFEEGSSLHAHIHYPFENEAKINTFPKDLLVHFISDFSDFPFHSILVHVALFGQSPWRNVFLTHKMDSQRSRFSRNLRQLLDWTPLVKEHGSDALRLYLLDTLGNVCKPTHFFDKNLNSLKKCVFPPLCIIVDFLIENVKLFHKKNETKINQIISKESFNFMDQWILSESHQFVSFVHSRFENFETKLISNKLIEFLENVKNWFIRLNKQRLKGNQGASEWKQSLFVLREICLNTLIVMSPMIPNFTEFLYSHLKETLPEQYQKESIHHFKFPIFEKNNEEIGNVFNQLKIVIKNGRRLKESLPLNSKIPKMILCIPKENIKFMESMKDVISRELLVNEIEIVWNFEPIIQMKSTSIHKKYFQKYKTISNVNKQLSKFSHDDLVSLMNKNKLFLEGVEVFASELIIKRKCVQPSKDYIFIEFDESIMLMLRE